MTNQPKKPLKELLGADLYEQVAAEAREALLNAGISGGQPSPDAIGLNCEIHGSQSMEHRTIYRCGACATPGQPKDLKAAPFERPSTKGAWVTRKQWEAYANQRAIEAIQAVRKQAHGYFQDSGGGRVEAVYEVTDDQLNDILAELSKEEGK